MDRYIESTKRYEKFNENNYEKEFIANHFAFADGAIGATDGNRECVGI